MATMGAGVFSIEACNRTAAAVALACACLTAQAASAADGWFTTSDGVRLHYIESGPADGRTVVLIPGWTLPAWIFQTQIDALDDRFHVLALDPRGQGDSEVAPFGYTAERRGRDIGELIDHAAASGRVVLVGWSLGALEVLSLLADRGDDAVAGLVLIDNSIGEGPPPAPRAAHRSAAPDISPTPEQRRAMRSAFVSGLFARDPGQDYRDRLTASALRMSPADEARLRLYDVPRGTWRQTLHGTDRPVLYVVRPRLRDQAEALTAARPNARAEVFETAGHALFVDEPDRFNALLLDFLDARADWGPTP